MTYFPIRKMTNSRYADYTDQLDFSMRESVLSIQEIFEKFNVELTPNVLSFDQDHLLILEAIV